MDRLLHFKKVSVIIPTIKGREQLLKRLLLTIPKQCEVIIVADEHLLLAAKRNKGAKQATGEYFLFIDDDNYLEENAIQNALKEIYAESSATGMVGFMACYDDRKYAISDGGSKRNHLTGFTTGINTNRAWPGDSEIAYEVDEVANAFMIHSELFFELYGFDEKNFPIDLDEADLCKRVKDKGYEIVICPTARCYHKSQTYSAMPDFRRPLNAYFLPRNKLLFQRKHNSRLRFWVHVIFFLPLHIGIYTASLIWRKKFSMIPHYLKGTWHGLLGRRKNKYQTR